MKNCGTLLKMAAAVAFVSLTAACGAQDKNWVKDANIETYNMNGEIYGSITTYLDSGSMSLPNLTLPIYDRRNPGQPVGSFTIKQSLFGDAKSELTVAVNLSQVADLPGTGAAAVLPNGEPLPVAGIDPANLLVFDVAGSKAKVYLDLDTLGGRAMFGVAVPIKQFDQIGRYTGGANLFPAFELENGMRGTFGIFTGITSGNSGFALFLDASSLLKAQPAAGLSIASASGPQRALSVVPREFDYLDQAPNQRKEEQIARGLHKLNQRRTRLDLAR